MKKLIITILILSLSLSIFTGCSSTLPQVAIPDITEKETTGEFVQNPDETEKYTIQYLDKDNTTWLPFNEDAILFSEVDEFEPGLKSIAVFQISNFTTKDFKWRFVIETDEPVSKLAEVLEIKTFSALSVRDPDEYSSIGNLDEFINNQNGVHTDVVSSKTVGYFGIMLKMSETAGNEYHGLNISELKFSFISVPVTNYASSDGTTSEGLAITVSSSATENNGNNTKTFTNILPGDVIPFTPYVKNTGTTSQFVRIKITISDYFAFKKIYESDDFASSLLKGLDTNLVKSYRIADNDEIEYTYYLNELLMSDASVLVFNQVEIPLTLTQSDVANTSLKDGFSVTVVADAIKTDTFPESNSGTTISAAAKEAFENAGL